MGGEGRERIASFQQSGQTHTHQRPRNWEPPETDDTSSNQPIKRLLGGSELRAKINLWSPCKTPKQGYECPFLKVNPETYRIRAGKAHTGSGLQGQTAESPGWGPPGGCDRQPLQANKLADSCLCAPKGSLRYIIIPAKQDGRSHCFKGPCGIFPPPAKTATCQDSHSSVPSTDHMEGERSLGRPSGPGCPTPLKD